MNLSLWRALSGGEWDAMGEEPVNESAPEPVKAKRRGGRRKTAKMDAPVALERGADTGDLDLRVFAGADEAGDDGAGDEAGAEDPADGGGRRAGGWRAPAARPYLDDPAWAPEPMDARGSANAGEAGDDPDLPWWLALNRVRGVGPVRFRLLIEAFGSARDAWEAQPADWRQIGMDERTAAAFARQRRLTHPDAELETMARLRVAALRVVDAAYPRLLKEIPAPPPVIYVRGRLEPGDELALAVVGTRRVSAYGRTVTERLVGELAAQA